MKHGAVDLRSFLEKKPAVRPQQVSRNYMSFFVCGNVVIKLVVVADNEGCAIVHLPSVYHFQHPTPNDNDSTTLHIEAKAVSM